MNKSILYKFSAIAILFNQNIIYSQAVNFGVASNFVVFTGDVAIANIESLAILGNVGANIGVISCIITSTVTGSIYNADMITNQAKLDLIISYNHLIAMPATNLIHTPAFGIGETLSPGMYSTVGTGSVGGNLTLDTIGDTNAVFVFRFGGALNIGAAATINLTNGTKACNVYWVSERATANSAAVYAKGNFICNAGAIAFGSTSSFVGRLMLLIFMGNWGGGCESSICSGTILLPIELI